jgi:hypothetical protein
MRCLQFLKLFQLNELSPFMSTTKTKTLLWGKVTPLSQSKIQPPQLGGLEIVLTKHIFAFMGYEGPHDRQQEKFIGLLDRSSITYRMCSADDENEFIKNAPKT